MRLVMLFGDEVIDQIRVDCDKFNTPGYIAYLQEELISRNEEILACCADLPRFVIENVPSRRAFESLLTVHGKQLLSQN